VYKNVKTRTFISYTTLQQYHDKCGLYIERNIIYIFFISIHVIERETDIDRENQILTYL